MMYVLSMLSAQCRQLVIYIVSLRCGPLNSYTDYNSRANQSLHIPIQIIYLHSFFRSDSAYQLNTSFKLILHKQNVHANVGGVVIFIPSLFYIPKSKNIIQIYEKNSFCCALIFSYFMEMTFK